MIHADLKQQHSLPTQKMHKRAKQGRDKSKTEFQVYLYKPCLLDILKMLTVLKYSSYTVDRHGLFRTGFTSL